ncbi:hypothetical protein D3C72_1206880 [compost metagenome]
MAAPGPQHDSGDIEAADPQLALVAKAHGGGVQAQAAVIAHVDIGVDAVVAHLPQHRAQPHRDGGQRHHVLRVGPGHQHAPVKADAQHHLRPVRDALAQRVDEDEGQHGQGQPAAHLVQEEQQRSADQQLAHQEPHGVLHRQLAAGQRTEARAFDVLVEVAVAHVVDGAADAAHQQRAQRKDDQPLQVGQPARGLNQRGNGGQQREPRADGPVQAAKAGVGTPRLREPAFDPVGEDDVAEIDGRLLRGAHCHGQKMVGKADSIKQRPGIAPGRGRSIAVQDAVFRPHCPEGYGLLMPCIP